MLCVLIAELCHVHLYSYNLHSCLREIFEHKLCTPQFPLMPNGNYAT